MIPVFSVKNIEIKQETKNLVNLDVVFFAEQISPIEFKTMPHQQFKIKGLKVPKTMTSFNVAISGGHWYIIQCDGNALLMDSSADRYDLMIDGATDKQYAMVPYPFPKDGVHIKREGDHIIVNGKPYPLQDKIGVKDYTVKAILRLPYYEDDHKFLRMSSVEIKHLTKGPRSKDGFIELADTGKLKDSVFINKDYEMFFTSRFIRDSSIFFWDKGTVVKITSPKAEYLIMGMRNADSKDMFVRTTINYQST